MVPWYLQSHPVPLTRLTLCHTSQPVPALQDLSVFSGVHLWRQDQARGGVYKALLQQHRGSPGRSHLHLPPAGIPPDQQPPVLAALGSTPPRPSGPTGNTARVALPQPLGASGAMDNASDYGSEDCRFDSCLARLWLFLAKDVSRDRCCSLSDNWRDVVTLKSHSIQAR